MPNLGRLTETMMGGGIVALSAETIGEDTLHRWYQDYRSGDAERADILKAEIAIMLRRAAVTGWDELLTPWIEPAAPVDAGGDAAALRGRHDAAHPREPQRAAAGVGRGQGGRAAPQLRAQPVHRGDARAACTSSWCACG